MTLADRPAARIRSGPLRTGEVPLEQPGEAAGGPTAGDAGLAASEEALLDGAFRMARRRRERLVRIDVPDPDWTPPAVREGEPVPLPPILFSFHVRPLTETIAEKANDDTAQVEINAYGIPIPVKQNQAALHSELIIQATVESDRARLWHNPRMLAEAGVVDSRALVDELLPMGYKELVIDKINAISGFGREQRRQRDVLLSG